MIQRIAGVLLLALMATACGGNGATKFSGPPTSTAAAFGTCAFCHPDQATAMLPTSADLTCEVCHADQMPGTVGPGHRAIPGPETVPSFAGPEHALGSEAPFGACAYCHNEFAKSLLPAGSTLRCQTCHDDQQPGQFGPGHQSLPGPDRVPVPAAAAHAVGPEGTFGPCAFCHNNKATDLQPFSNELHCQSCHDDLQPGSYGAGHQSRPGPDRVPAPPAAAHVAGPAAPLGSCAFCHNPFATNMIPTSADLQCPVCHADRQPGMFGPAHRALPGPELVPSFAGPEHALGAQAPFGSCAFCHNEMAVNINASGTQDLRCETCHQTALSDMFGPQHRSLPGPDVVPSFVGPSHRLGAESQYGSCGFCHNELTVHAFMASGHGMLSLDCKNCHTERSELFGPMHQRVPACAECHSGPKTHHDPALGTQSECAVCHEPHGSTNLFLIREMILTPSGITRPVTLDNLLGLADGSFASVSHPGTGLCETCHTTTRYFRADGSGLTHFPYACFTCHPHSIGFAPS